MGPEFEFTTKRAPRRTVGSVATELADEVLTGDNIRAASSEVGQLRITVERIR